MKFSTTFLVIILLFVALGCRYFDAASKPIVSDQVLEERFRNQKADFKRLAEILETTVWENNPTLIKEMDEIEKKIKARSSAIMLPKSQRLTVFVADTQFKGDNGGCTDYFLHKGYIYSRETAETLAEKSRTAYDGRAEFKPLGENWYIYFRPSVEHDSTERCGKE